METVQLSFNSLQRYNANMTEALNLKMASG